MKNDINLFDDEFKEEIASSKEGEKEVKRKEKAYRTALKNLQATNKKRIEVINRIRLEKLAEIAEEIKISELEIETLTEERVKILHTYCEKNNHNYALLRQRYLSSTGKHSFGRGFQNIYDYTYKCTICGRETSFTTTGYDRRDSEKYCAYIPEDVYDNETLTTDGKTLRIIEQEILKLKEYLNYLDYLKDKMCELFGHDAIIIDYEENFKCQCCGRTLGYQEYIDAHYKAKYLGIVPFYYNDNINGSYITRGEKESYIPLPTFEVYQRTLKKKEENK